MRITGMAGMAATVAALALMAGGPTAQAGLVGDTVSAYFFLGASSVPTPPFSNASEQEDYDITPGNPVDTPAPTVPVTFIEGAMDGSTINVDDTSITITNDLSGVPFCSTADPCNDAFTGFAFAFSSGANISNVTVDSTSASDFLPSAGGLTFGSDYIIVNVVGDLPNAKDQLVLDVTTGTSSGTPPTSTPEPGSLALLAVGLAGCLAVRWGVPRAG
ncbi:MAG TPA: PEP-CTERM sorting domain-containing protein [Stellaceae bacterium]|nr:PEP-CTERM sorting domain-containing protein [Stellaceae bacterium]